MSKRVDEISSVFFLLFRVSENRKLEVERRTEKGGKRIIFENDITSYKNENIEFFLLFLTEISLSVGSPVQRELGCTA